MLVHVHAYEDAPGSEAGAGGFDWFRDAADADKAFAESGREAHEAHFRFDVDVDATTDEGITEEIDASLAELTAAAERRFVGAEVLEYWKANGFDMGDADGPARSAPSV